MPNISKAKFDEMTATIDILTKQADQERARRQDFEARIIACDRILEKIVRASNGVSLIQMRDTDGYGMTSNFSNYNPPHRCTPFTTEEIRQGELEGLREQTLMLAERLAAVRAIAVFASEHKL